MNDMDEKQKITDILEKLVDALASEAEAIKNYILAPQNTSFSSDVFDSPVIFDNDPPKNATKDKTYKALRGKKGIYVFTLASDVTVTKDFNKVVYGAQLKDISSLSFKKGDILYLGKAKSFLTRMHQHFAIADTFNTTGALKLGSDPRKILIGNLKIYAFPIKNTLIDYYDVITAAVESKIHTILSPLVGNPRV